MLISLWLDMMKNFKYLFFYRYFFFFLSKAVRVDIFKGKQDVKKDLLTLGYYKLASNAF